MCITLEAVLSSQTCFGLDKVCLPCDIPFFVESVKKPPMTQVEAHFTLTTIVMSKQDHLSTQL